MIKSATPVLGLDIGGANLKAAHTSGAARSRPFALWKNPGGLSSVLTEFLSGWPEHELLAATMTGELCDCFASRREGVHAILDAIEQSFLTAENAERRREQSEPPFVSPRSTALSAAKKPPPLTPIRIWCNDGTLVSIAAARAS